MLIIQLSTFINLETEKKKKILDIYKILKLMKLKQRYFQLVSQQHFTVILSYEYFHFQMQNFSDHLLLNLFSGLLN